MIQLEHYNYHLPKNRIATAPMSPRDHAKLFVYDTKTDEVVVDTFLHIDKYLPKNSVLVFNNTKVIPARLWLQKETGGKIQVLLMMNEFRPGDTLLKGIVDRTVAPGARLFFPGGEYLEVKRQEEQYFFFAPNVPIAHLLTLIKKHGVTPIPPYIKATPLSERSLRKKYQSMFAKHPASVAAPTASLHFTPRVLFRLTKAGMTHAEITLHVGAGTFAPIDEANFESKTLFTEYYDIPTSSARLINTRKKDDGTIIPVGTTAMRTLESAAHPVRRQPSYNVSAGANSTNIFIYPPYEFRIADAMITNFHVPRSSLMLLVDAFLKHKKAKRDILALYDIAIREQFRFYSFGDGMLIK